jgi:uncharacterized protein YbjT (DUF2867 family)
MRILLTGATGYIAQRLLPVLLNDGHEVVCCVRDARRFHPEKYSSSRLSVVETDFLDPSTLRAIPDSIDAAYYLIHSMADPHKNFSGLEEQSAINFRNRMNEVGVQQVVYLGGIVNERGLSKHLESRRNVETILSSGSYALTTLRAGIIVGSGSASFEIIRDLVEKLPIMIAPKWLETRSQPIAIRNVVDFLRGVLLNRALYGRTYDIGGPEILTYKQMLLIFAERRRLKRRVIIVPVLTPRLSSYWLYFVTATSYGLAQHLVDSMKVEIVCRPNDLAETLGIRILSYGEAIDLAFDKIEQHQVLSSWKDALATQTLERGISHLVEVPHHGCFIDRKSRRVDSVNVTLMKIWSIGGRNGWYYADWLWSMRGFLDRLIGGVGLRRGRKNPADIEAGESLDFWRVLYADRDERRLLLYAEMKLPGEAWLEFHIDQKDVLYQTATFRPRGLWGRLYWYAVLPFHYFIFNGMIDRLASEQSR